MTISLSFQSLLPSLKPKSFHSYTPLSVAQAVISDEILPGQRGRVKYQATYWFAITENTLPMCLKVGDKVRVINRRGNTLVVEPE